MVERGGRPGVSAGQGEGDNFGKSVRRIRGSVVGAFKNFHNTNFFWPAGKKFQNAGKKKSCTNIAL